MGITVKKTEVAQEPPASPPAPAVQSIAKPESKPDPKPEPKKMSESQAIIAQIKKEKGENLVTSGRAIPIVERIPTGIFEFDLATGGGFPRSRYSIVYGPESSGKTNLCYAAAVQTQRLPSPCNKVVWVDLEGTFSPDWASRFGIDVDELIVVRPAYGEEAVDLVDALVRAEDVALLVVDSIATVVSSKEVEQSVEKFDVGTAAILVKRMCNKLAIALSTEARRGHCPAVILINQTRFKIGCFDYNTRVRLADGTSMKIGKIVTNKMEVEVLSMCDDGTLVPRKVVDWADNGLGDDWLDFCVKGGNSGLRKFRVTRGHSIFTPGGEKHAGDLKPGDFVLSEGYEYYTTQQHEILLGSILGDGSLRFDKNGPRGYIRLGHGHAQYGYLKWKADLLGAEVSTYSNVVEATTKHSIEFQRYKPIQKKKGLIDLPDEFIDKITPLALAIWYMDDGTYSGSHSKWGWGKPSIAARLLSKETLKKIARHLAIMGAGRASVKEGVGLTWSGEEARNFLWRIKDYIPSCMAYKVKEGYARGDSFSVEKMPPLLRTYPEEIHSITSLEGERRKFDITVEGNHNYLADGVVVHNTMFGNPETQPGGQTLKFLSSLTIRLSGKNKVEKAISSEIPAFKETNATIMKAKVGVVKYNFSYDMCLLEHDGMIVGETKSWNTVAGYLKDLGYLKKAEKGQGWTLLGQTYQTLVLIQDRYEADDEFKMELQGLVIKAHEGKHMVVEAEGAAKG